MTLYLPDISGWDAGIDLSGALAVVIKVTQGTGYVNPYYTAQLAEARRRGAYPLAYHFLEAGNADEQADHCAAQESDLPLAVDFEPVDPPNGQSYPSITDLVRFVDRYRSHGGTSHIAYLPHWYWARGANGLGGAPLKPLADLGMVLWSSSYGAYTDADSGAGWQPYGGITPALWQYTSTMDFGGSQVDFSAFRGSAYAGKQDAGSVAAALAEFHSVASTGKYAPLPPPPVTGTVKIPAIRGMSAGHAHDRLMAAHLVPVGRAGQKPSDIAMGSTPAGGTVATGSRVSIVAGPAPELREGAAGEFAALAQTDLNKAGAHLGVDGDFGGITLKAVYGFQKDHGLLTDGRIGPLTWQALGAQ
jgi:GH25 family lysozyme M1 (1,4-beta-N-acetylmuramidase)